MAHDLAQTASGEYMTAWAGSTPWHGLGTSVEGLMTTTEALQKAHLDWSVVKLPLWYDKSEDFTVNPSFDVVPDTFGVFRESEEGLVPLTRGGKAVGRVWKPLQNVDAFAFMDEILQSHEAAIEVAGALGNGETVWILAKLPDTIIINGQDPVEQYFLITNKHDGTGAVKFLPTPIRVVCQNTLSGAIAQGKSSTYNVRHTSKMGERVDDVRRALGIMNKQFVEWGEQASKLATVQYEIDDVKEYFIDVLGLKRDPETGEMADNTKTKLKMNKLMQLLSSPQNNVGDMGGTWWSAYNAVTEYIDHHATTLRNGEKSRKGIESAIFGPYARKKKIAWELALEVIQ